MQLINIVSQPIVYVADKKPTVYVYGLFQAQIILANSCPEPNIHSGACLKDMVMKNLNVCKEVDPL